MTKKQKRFFQSVDGTNWSVEVRSPSSSSAMVVFAYPGARTSRLDRYAWYQWSGPEASAVNSSLIPQMVLDRLSDQDLKLLFRRSMPIYTTV